MNLNIEKHHARYIAVLIERRMAFLKNKIVKENKDDWYDYESEQIETKICEVSDEYQRLDQCINEFYKK